ncbi:MAG: hypothetical protein ACE5H1_11950 [Thermodesulfobacteriota bacterium]
MSDLKQHIVQGTITSSVLFPFIGKDAFIVGASVVLIDLDHIIEYIHASGTFDVKGMFNLRNIAKNHLHEVIGLNIFHTIECYLVLLTLGIFVNSLFLYILSGFIIHHIFDQIYLVKLGYPFVRAFSIVEYCFRSKRLLTIKQLLKTVALKDKLSGNQEIN